MPPSNAILTSYCYTFEHFKDETTTVPLLTIESPVAQWLEHPTRSRSRGHGFFTSSQLTFW